MHEFQPVVDFLKRNELVLATAESCTAGLTAARLAEVPGTGSVMKCGYVVYAIETKREMLGVNLETIERYGLTSEEVAREMALGALERCGADVTLANTGLAEANGEMGGTLCFACALLLQGQQQVFSETVKFSGKRNQVREQAARYALLSLERYVIYLRQQSR